VVVGVILLTYAFSSQCSDDLSRAGQRHRTACTSDADGLVLHLHSGLTLSLVTEGSWDDVTRLIGQAHTILHEKGIVRIQTDIRIGSRTDKAQTMEDKVAAVEKLLSSDT
jgi:uncharacterized protein (TIGR00106 family)